MKCGGGGCSQRDLVGGVWALVLWCLPTGLILVGALLPAARAVLWIPSFAIMGIACLANARGCGRLHCFVTGPLFLLAALASALDAFEVVRIDWRMIFVGVGVGTLLAYSFEWRRGKYVGAWLP
jgi:hypothetical protein